MTHVSISKKNSVKINTDFSNTFEEKVNKNENSNDTSVLTFSSVYFHFLNAFTFNWWRLVVMPKRNNGSWNVIYN